MQPAIMKVINPSDFLSSLPPVTPLPPLISSPHPTLSFCLSLSVVSAGGARQHEKEMQVPRDVRELPAEDLLASHPGVPGGGLNPQRALPHRHAYQGSQPEHGTARPLPPQQPPPPSSPSEQPPHTSAAAKRQRAGVL